MKRPTITFSLCVAAGVAAGIGLARPNPTASAPATAPAIEQTPTESNPSTGYAEGGSDGSPAPTTPTAAIAISGFDFGAPITAQANQTIQVSNNDGVAHTLTADDGSFDTGTIGGGAIGTADGPATPGTYQYFCAIHPSMRGSLTVTG